MDVWFSRFDDRLYCVTTKHNEGPARTPFRVRPKDGADDVLRRMVEAGHNIEQVGICPPEMLGIE